MKAQAWVDLRGLGQRPREAAGRSFCQGEALRLKESFGLDGIRYLAWR
jgi:hypothetical protein